MGSDLEFLDGRECLCAGPGLCPLRGREVTVREHAACACTCPDPAFCLPDLCHRRRVRWLNDRRRAAGLSELPPPAVAPSRVQPGGGPGTELKAVLAALGFASQGSCGCEGYASLMDRWGVDGCKQRRPEILAWLRNAQAKLGWGETIRAAVNAAAAGLAFRVNPLDPAPGLLDEAIRRAESRPHEPVIVPQGPPVAVSAGVCIGCYGLPRLAELQILLIRDTNGPVPILIADDGSPEALELEALGDRYPDVTAWVSPERRGHYAGDLSVFWKCVQWGRVRGFDRVAKVSQRMLVERPGWLHEVLALMGEEPVAAQRCLDNGTDLFVRSELMALDPGVWSRPDTLRELDKHELNNPTELHLNHLITTRFGGLKATIPFLTIDRYAKSEGVVWHGSDQAPEFHRAAARFGVDLGADFYSGGWQHAPGWKRG